MKRIPLLSIAVLGPLCAPLFAATNPDILVILADDTGYGDSDCYAPTKIKTPNIDRLASQGMRFTTGHAMFATRTQAQ